MAARVRHRQNRLMGRGRSVTDARAAKRSGDHPSDTTASNAALFNPLPPRHVIVPASASCAGHPEDRTDGHELPTPRSIARTSYRVHVVPSREGCRPRRTDPLFAARAHQIDCWATARENLPREPKPSSGRSIHDRGQSDDRARCRRNSDLPIGGPAESENRFGPKPIARACGSRSVPRQLLPTGAE